MVATPPRPLNAPAWISINDYPAEAITQRSEGTVAVRLEIDGSGRVSSCAIATSSGARSLDSATCALIFLRAQFDAARDENGRAVAGVYATRITWRYPLAIAPNFALQTLELDERAIQEATGSSVLHVDAAGMITACEPRERPYANVMRPPDICGLFPVGARFSPPTTRKGHPVKRKVNVDLSITSFLVR